MNPDVLVGWLLIAAAAYVTSVFVLLNWQYDRWQRNNPRCDTCAEVAESREHVGSNR